MEHTVYNDASDVSIQDARAQGSLNSQRPVSARKQGDKKVAEDDVEGLLNGPGRHVLASDPPWQMVRSKAAPAPRTVSFELVIPMRVAPERLHAIEDLLEAALSAVPEASVDGSAAAEDHSIIFVYGPEGGTLADKLGAVVASGAFPPGTEVRPL